ncbi:MULTISPECIES: helix-turn-helix domain-containing protein [unclassified Brevundimonas]|nr:MULTISPECIES: helix-turn-helix domain-containing protein [unclassified Brevundimonas]
MTGTIAEAKVGPRRAPRSRDRASGSDDADSRADPGAHAQRAGRGPTGASGARPRPHRLRAPACQPRRGGCPADPEEFEVLAHLARHLGKVVSHQDLLTAVWGKAQTDDTPYLRVVVGQLRNKLEAVPAEPSLLLTEPGVGYRLEAAADGGRRRLNVDPRP